MKKYLPVMVFFLTLTLISDAYAGAAGDIFDKLAMKAGVVGSGLRRSGFAIAGLGMIMFTFLAIFNKIQWKHLAYIMFSTAVLSGMIALITEIRTDTQGRVQGTANAGSLQFSTQGYSMSDAEGGSDAREVEVERGG